MSIQVGDKQITEVIDGPQDSLVSVGRYMWEDPLLMDAGISPRSSIVESHQIFVEGDEIPINTYIYHDEQKSSKPGPLVMYIHGGSVKPGHGIGNYPGLIYAAGHGLVEDNFVFCGFDHRGSHSVEQNSGYSLQTRYEDVRRVIEWFSTNDHMIDKWNGKVMLIGVSMGGHVASHYAYFHSVDSLALVVPAMYGQGAQHANFGSEFKQAITGTYSQSVIPILLQRMLAGNPNVDLTLISKLSDAIVHREIIAFMTSPVYDLYLNRRAKGAPCNFVHLRDEGGHSGTSIEELELLANMIGRLT